MLRPLPKQPGAPPAEIPKPLLIVLGLAAAVGAGVLIAAPRLGPAVLAGLLCLGALTVGFLRPSAALLATFTWLPMVGIVRRLPLFAVPATSVNPLLIVAPVAAGVLLVVSLRRGTGRLNLFASAVLAMSIAIFFSAFNPLQGGLKVGFGGVFLSLTPLLWFWIGRGFVYPDLLGRLSGLILAVAVLAGLYGLAQTLVGFPSFDQAWILDKGYAALNVGGTIRAFGGFSSSAEYATFLGIGLVVLAVSAKRMRPLTVAASGLVLLSALFLNSSRGIVGLAVLALVVVVLARRHVAAWKTVAFGAMALIALSLGARMMSLVPVGDTGLGALIQHQVGGLADPFDETKSTLGIHTNMVSSGIAQVLDHPLGYGAGAVTIASQKFGGKNIGSTEVDFSNAAVALGVPGLVLFTFIAIAGALLAYEAARRKPNLATLAALGILTVTALQWLNGGQYAVAPLPWLFLGWLDRERLKATAKSSDDFDWEKDPIHEDPEPLMNSATAIPATPALERPRVAAFEPIVAIAKPEPSVHRAPAPALTPSPAPRSDPDGQDFPIRAHSQELGPLVPPGGWFYRTSVRALDLVLGATGLVLCLPIAAVLALPIRLTTGRVLFHQVRLGQAARPFRLFKLRTLRATAPSQVPKRDAEGMATPIGRFLRATKLDEAPQFWNVIKGEMAMVGPRPIIPEEYSEKSDYQRLKVRPGLTGLWQLSHARGNPFDDSPEYDLFYLANRSIGLDLWILWRTALFLVTGRETKIDLAAHLWEKSTSWRSETPRAAHEIPEEDPSTRPLWKIAAVAIVATPLTLAFRAGLLSRPWPENPAKALAKTIATDAPRLLVWAAAFYVVSAAAALAFMFTVGRRGGFARRAVLGFGVFVGAALLAGVPALLQARTNLRQAQGLLLQAAASAKTLDTAGAESSFRQANALALTAGRRLDSRLTLGVRLVPILRGNIQTARALARGVTIIIPGLDSSLRASEIFSSTAPGRTPLFANGRLDLGLLSQMSAPLKSAAKAARSAARVAKDSKGSMLVPSLSQARAKFISQSEGLSKALTGASKAVELLPPMLGANGARTYFLMIQNGAEQRGTGGYLGAFGILHADSGQLTLQKFDANSALPQGKQVEAPTTEFADRYDRFKSRSSWSNINMTPDFPTASGLIAGLWQKGTGQKIDGVVAIDAPGLAELMKAAGPVAVPGLGEPVTAANFVPLVLNQAYVRFPQKDERVDFLLPVGREVWTRLLAGGQSARVLAQSFGAILSTGHMQVWSGAEAPALRELGVDGSLKPAIDSDYLMVVGQNAAGNKVDYYARRSIAYEVHIGAGGKTSGKAEVIIKNGAPTSGLPTYILGPFADLKDPPGLNRTYLSLYLPAKTSGSAAKLDGKPVGLESHSERGLGVVSKFVETVSGNSSRLELKLQSALSRAGEYRLLVQHQPGLNPDQMRLSVRIPAGMVVKSMTGGMQVDGQRVIWRGNLVSDREFVVKFGSPGLDSWKNRLKGTVSWWLVQ
ncbi:MAG: sugar transferase [Actinomycetota bacterium]